MNTMPITTRMHSSQVPLVCVSMGTTNISGDVDSYNLSHITTYMNGICFTAQ